MIKILPDEYGYWAAGNYFSGVNAWKDFSSTINYYGYGYGLILAPFIRMGLSGMACYRVAIWLNGGLIYLIYRTIRKLLDDIITEDRYFTKWALALCFCFMSANAYYLQYTMAEVVIAFVYWRIIYYVYNAIKYGRIRDFVLLEIGNFALVALHQRCIGVVLCSVLFLAYYFFSRRAFNVRSLLFVVTAIGLMVLFVLIKHDFKDNSINAIMTSAVNTDRVDVNDISGVAYKIKFFLSKQGIVNFIALFLGRLFYAASATFIWVIVGIVSIVNFVAQNIKKSSLGIELVNGIEIELFSLLCLFAEIGVGAIFFIFDYNSRFDILTYARYFEFSIAPFAFFSFINFVFGAHRGKAKILMPSLAVYVILSKFIDYIENYANPNSGNPFIQSYIIRFFMLKNDYAPHFFIRMFVFVIIVFVIMSIFLHYFKSNCVSVICIFMAVFYLYASNYVYAQVYDSWIKKNATEIMDVLDIVDDLQIGDSLKALYYPDQLWTYQIQASLMDKTINVIQDTADLKKGDALIVSSWQQYEDLIDLSQFNVLYEGEYFLLLNYN
ncbi:hypothetical protein [Butyrivibrio fibrisolvens]|uniref:hypothetical protein n=1 Tax=Butyrivibrio fibrisolvens TaxID=831 RepID=UPI0012BCAB22|nr:hypothetical protein [Butyrivibrio fibrisolvens]